MVETFSDFLIWSRHSNDMVETISDFLDLVETGRDSLRLYSDYFRLGRDFFRLFSYVETGRVQSQTVFILCQKLNKKFRLIQTF